MANAAKVALGVNKNAMWMTMAVRDITSWTGHNAQGHGTGPALNLQLEWVRKGKWCGNVRTISKKPTLEIKVPLEYVVYIYFKIPSQLLNKNYKKLNKNFVCF